jgi:adenosylmethionine-8-amino-7-oxononanoate aminotransferase
MDAATNTETGRGTRTSDGIPLGEAPASSRNKRAQRRVRHFLADFGAIEERYPDLYPRFIERGEGAFVYDDEGNRLLDLGLHLGATMIGHGRREIGDRLARQAGELEFIALDSGVSHPKALELADRIAAVVPIEDPTFSFTSSGSEANEVAFKIARGYHARRGESQRTKIISRDGSYHGSSYGGLSATHAAAFQAGFGPLVPDFVTARQPSPGRCGLCDRETGCNLGCAAALEAAIAAEGPETVAAVIAEPVAIFQAVKPPHEEYWNRVRDICDATGALLIVDEVVTGFGRTGKLFGSEHWEIRPDVMTMAKGMTSGYVPLGAAVVSAEVQEAFANAPLLHQNTFAGHPLACEAALATLDVLEHEQLPERASAMEPVLRQSLELIKERHPRAFRAAAIGLLGSIELDAGDLDGEMPDRLIDLRHELYQSGVLARCAYSDEIQSVIISPALVVDDDDLRTGIAAIGDALATVLP